MTHETSIESHYSRRRYMWRWACTCGQRGDWVKPKRRAVDGAAYHAYAKRAMTADEVLTMGDSMYGDLTREQAQERAERANEQNGWG